VEIERSGVESFSSVVQSLNVVTVCP
jgi:hypothetical protein